MKVWLSGLLALSLALGTLTPHARAEEPVDAGSTPRRELETANEQHETAVRIHVASTIIGLAGAGGLLGRVGDGARGPPELSVIRGAGAASWGRCPQTPYRHSRLPHFESASQESTAAFFLVVGGGSLSIVNLVLVIVGVSLDLGSASRRRRLLAAHPELAAALVPGPGDAGLGLALRF
jgi:hypothetical protein